MATRADTAFTAKTLASGRFGEIEVFNKSVVPRPQNSSLGLETAVTTNTGPMFVCHCERPKDR
jgi:hypothetical protein